MIRISIVENDKFLLNTLAMVLSKNEKLEVVGLFSKPVDALVQIPVIKPNVVLMDLNLGDHQMDGVECIARIKAANPDIMFMVLTIYEDHESVFNALAAGALGYILKSATKEKIIESIEEMFNGGSPMSSSIARKIAMSFGHNSKDQKDNKFAGLLTIREKEVIELISRGKIEKEVATELNISYKTVKAHISNIYSKLHVNTRVDALNKYFGR
jgi:DNA-binding NarL/FixJ family response regulator